MKCPVCGDELVTLTTKDWDVPPGEPFPRTKKRRLEFPVLRREPFCERCNAARPAVLEETREP